MYHVKSNPRISVNVKQASVQISKNSLKVGHSYIHVLMYNKNFEHRLNQNVDAAGVHNGIYDRYF